MGARPFIVLVTLLGLLPIEATAQTGNMGTHGPSSRGIPSPPPRAAQRAPVAPAPSVRPSAPPSHPLPQPFAGTVPDPIMRPPASNDVFTAGPRTYAPRYGRFSGRGSLRPWTGAYAYGTDGGYVPYAQSVPEESLTAQGRLNLYVTPGSTQVLVDGFFGGTVADFQDRGLWLPAGPHRIELRADGYDSVTFDVRIVEDRSVEYQRNLAKEAGRSEPPRASAQPKTFYVIPGCYAGDSPPEAGRLPRGCSSRNVKTIPPVLSRFTRR